MSKWGLLVDGGMMGAAVECFDERLHVGCLFRLVLICFIG